MEEQSQVEQRNVFAEWLFAHFPEPLVKRVQSFLWRYGMMFLAGLVEVAIQSLSDFQLPAGVVTLLGLMLGEASKYLNSRTK